MKKLLIVLMVLVITFGITACGKKDATANNSKPDVSTPSTESKVESAVEETEDKEWGVTERIVVEINNNMQSVFVNFSDFTGPSRASGRLGIQSDNTVTILDGQVATTKCVVESGKVEDVFPTYFEQTKAIMAKQYIGYRKNFEFKVTDKENVTINGYDMCKFVGTHTYEIIGEKGSYSQKFVAYATKTNKIGAFVYWMVLDGTVDGTNEDKLEDIALKMANTFNEQE